MFKLNEELANKLLNYLASKPFAEVWQLINELQKVEKIEKCGCKKEEVKID